MIGLALEGGGIKGSYQAGVYVAMLECGIKINGVCGTSVGALNGAYIASGKGDNLPNIWQNLNVGKVFGFSQNFINAVSSKEKSINIINIIIKELSKIVLNKGIELEGLKEFVDKHLDVDALMNSDIDFGMVTVRAKDFKPIYLWKEEMDKNKIKEYVIASSFLPFFKTEKLIDDNYYLDGGFYDLGPVNMLLEKGYKKIYLVKLHSIGISRKYNEDADVVIIEPKRSLGSMFELDSNQIEENMKMGYYDAIRVLRNYDGYKYIFKPKNDKFYKFLNRKISEKNYRRVKSFFGSKSYKETTIKALEYVMEKENINYYDIYKVSKMLRYLKRKYKKKHFVYDYVNKLKYFI